MHAMQARVLLLARVLEGGVETRDLRVLLKKSRERRRSCPHQVVGRSVEREPRLDLPETSRNPM
jgi:hypothetical protein